ncbi:MAG TPA: hypothetical protein VGJ32_06570 [Solirubrobacteraceae bacterium]|jgi:hypothetical protein
MHQENTTPTTPEALDRELERLGPDAADRARPDQRPPRGNQEPEPDDVDRGRDKLERVL